MAYICCYDVRYGKCEWGVNVWTIYTISKARFRAQCCKSMRKS